MRFLKNLVATGLAMSIATAVTQGQPITDGQGDVGIGTVAPHPSAKLDVVSTTRGFLLPRMTTAQRDAIVSPANALLIFNTTANEFQWYDASMPGWTGLGAAAGPFWRTDGNNITSEWDGATGQRLGTRNANDLSIVTELAQNIDFWTNNTQVAILTSAGDLGLNEMTPSARLDVVGDNANPAIEATNNGVVGIESTVDGGSGLLLGTYPAILGDGNGEIGVAGTSNTGIGVFGASNTNNGVNGLAFMAGVAGVFGRNDAAGGYAVLGISVGGGTGVRGTSSTGTAGSFATTGGAATTVVIDDASTGDALEVNAAGGGLGIDLNGGALDGDAAGNALGDGAAAQQLTIRGTADAVVGNTLAGNPTVWDQVVEGDQVVTGIAKIGGSVWIDGTSPTHQIQSSNPLLVNTVAGNIEIDAAGGQTTIDDNLVVTGTSDLQGAISNTSGNNGGNVFINDNATVASNFNVQGNTDLDGNLNVDGPSTFNNTIDQLGGAQVTFSGNVDAQSGLDVSGADLNVATNANITGNTQVTGDMNVDGVTTLDETTVDGTLDQTGGGQVTFSGNVDANNGLDVAGADLNVATNANITGNTQVTGDMNVDGVTTLDETTVDGTLDQTGGGQVTFSGNVDANNGLDVAGADLNVATNANITGNTQVTGDMNVDGVTTLDETTVDGTLDQTGGGQVTFSGNVDANNGLDVAGADLNVATNANITGNTQVTGDMNVDGVTTLDETTVDGTLDQTGGGQVTFSGNVDANNGLDVAGADLNVATNANITGNTQVTGDMNVDGVTTLDETTVDGTLDQTGGGQVTFSGNVDANNGLDVAGADLNVATNGQIDGNLNVDGTTTLDETTVDGTLDQTGGGQVTFSGNVDANGGVDVTGNLSVTGTSDLQGNIFSNTGDLNVADHIIPTADATYDLGSNANRWRDIYVDGASLHVGDAIGTEMMLGYAGNTGTLNVNGGSAEIEVDRGANTIRFDANGDGTLEAFVRGDGIGVNTGVGADLLISQDAFSWNSATDVTATFQNTGAGDVDVVIDGELDVNNTNGSSTIGTGADGLQLTVDGADGGLVDLQVNGDADITGTLTVGNFTLTGNLDMGGADIVNVGDVVFSSGTSSLSNTGGNVMVDDNLNVTDAVTVGTTLGVTGNSTFSTFTATGATTFRSASTWAPVGGGPPNTTVSAGGITVNATGPGAALSLNNTNANGQAINVAAGGGRTILSYGTGAGVIPQDVSVWNATGNVTLPGSTENGQVLYVVNTSGAAITVTGVTGGTAAGFNNNDVRGYVYAGGWFELP